MRELPSFETREAALYERFRALAIAWKTYEHAPVFTVAEADDVHAAIPGGHTKNLFLKDKKDGLWLIVLRDRLRVDLNALAKRLGAPRFSFGSAALLVEALGIDQGMLALDPLNFHPLRNDRTTAIAPHDLMKFIRACGHDPTVMDLPEAANPPL